VGVFALTVAVVRIDTQRRPEVSLGRGVIAASLRHIAELIQYPHSDSSFQPRVVYKDTAQGREACSELSGKTVNGGEAGQRDQVATDLNERPTRLARCIEMPLYLQYRSLGEPRLGVESL